MTVDAKLTPELLRPRVKTLKPMTKCSLNFALPSVAMTYAGKTS